MRALSLIAPGTPLQPSEFADPVPGGDDVLVEVHAAGICRSDVHYRAGFPQVADLPMTLGHEVAGLVAAVGPEVETVETGDRVCLHYQVGCGTCPACVAGGERFCAEGQMIGKDRPGGYADHIVVPARNVLMVPDAVPLDHAAVMMCSSATALHALRRGRLSDGETVAVFGVGGLGMSAVQLAVLEGARQVFAVDINPAKLNLAERLGAIPVDAGADPVGELRNRGGCDVAIDLVGSADVLRNCLDSLAPMGRAVAVGLTRSTVAVGPYTDLVSGESELVGTSDHLIGELSELLEWAADGRFRLDDIVQRHVPLDAPSVNDALDDLERFGDTVRTVIRPNA